jgi:hypothetical protein
MIDPIESVLFLLAFEPFIGRRGSGLGAGGLGLRGFMGFLAGAGFAGRAGGGGRRGGRGICGFAHNIFVIVCFAAVESSLPHSSQEICHALLQGNCQCNTLWNKSLGAPGNFCRIGCDSSQLGISRRLSASFRFPNHCFR